MHHPVAIANYFIHMNMQQKGIPAMGLLDLLQMSYMAHGFNLSFNNEPLSNELVQVSKHGPIFPSIFHTFKYHPPVIKRYGFEVEPHLGYGEGKPILSTFSNPEQELMMIVYRGNPDITAQFARGEDTPWYKLYHEGDKIGQKFQGVTISNEDIKSYFDTQRRMNNERQSA